MKPIPRVATIQDLSGLGRCSLTVILPVLSAMSVQCCPLTTAVLSTHTGFPKERLSFCDLTDQLEQSIQHWNHLEAHMDGVYSGFLGSARQMDVVTDYMVEQKERGAILLVDPVMADHGKVYQSYTAEMCQKMIALSNIAHVITPNLTEAALLLGEDYADVPTTRAGVEDWLMRLSLEGTRSVILTGIGFTTTELGAACFDHKRGEMSVTLTKALPGQFPGTGDLFASVVLGSLLQGQTLAQASQRAVDFVGHCVGYTLNLNTPNREGVVFEPMLKKLLTSSDAYSRLT